MVIIIQKNSFSGKKVLVTGGTGMIGRYLVDLLLEQGAHVRIASLDDPSRAHPKAEFIHLNLLHLENCMRVCEGIDYVFHLVGVKGSPAMTKTKPASFFVPIILSNTNMMEAARLANVQWYLYTSSVGVYAPAEIFYEDAVWETFPSENDKFAGWAKRMGELQAEAYAIEYGMQNTSIVRPANVYGHYDNFDPKSAMVIPSLIKRALDGEDPFTIWGDGTQIRDFVHAKDVARGMLFAVENGITEPLNLGSGVGVEIKKIVDIIVSNLEKKPQVIWDKTKPSGDKKRLMSMERAARYGFRNTISIEEGIKDVMNWYRANKDIVNKRYDVFTKNEK